MELEKNIKAIDYKKLAIKSIIAFVLIVVAYFVLKILIDNKIITNYYGRLIVMMCINIILAVSLNIVVGFTGQLTLGHAAFMSIGAYASAILTMKVHTPLIISLIFGALIAAIFSALIGYPILRLKGDYLAICTLGFGEIVKVIIQNIDFLGGPRGLSGIKARTNFTWVYFAMILTIIVVWNIMRSSQGRAMISVREDEIAAESMGINTTKYKMMGFILGAIFAAIAGGFYAHFLMFIDPKSFDFQKSTEILTFVVFGGMGSLSGSALGAAALTMLPELLRNLGENVQEYRMVIYSLLLIILMIFRPQGLLGTKEFSLKIFKVGSRFDKKGGGNNVITKG
jgi:branched-chain amino acid transport system permease protein